MGKTEGEVGAFHRRLLPFCQPDALYTDIIFFLILPLFNFFGIFKFVLIGILTATANAIIFHGDSRT